MFTYAIALDLCRKVFCQVYGLAGLASTTWKKGKELQLLQNEEGERTLKCYKCGQEGHPAFKCTNEPSANAKQCGLCGIWGHEAVRCFEDERNKDLRPPGWTS